MRAGEWSNPRKYIEFGFSYIDVIYTYELLRFSGKDAGGFTAAQKFFSNAKLTQKLKNTVSAPHFEGFTI